jgi:hypothetical protein
VHVFSPPSVLAQTPKLTMGCSVLSIIPLPLRSKNIFPVTSLNGIGVSVGGISVTVGGVVDVEVGCGNSAGVHPTVKIKMRQRI